MPNDSSQRYQQFVKPELARLFRALQLDVAYFEARGDVLRFRDESGRVHDVLDFLGGYGASLFGHNHPELVETLCQALRAGAVFNGQKSCRGPAAILAEQLSHRLGRVTGRAYVATLTNSGAEAAEAAMKHAALAYQTGCDEKARAQARALAKIVKRVHAGELTLPNAALPGSHPELRSSDDIQAVTELMQRAAAEAFATPPAFVALERAFHGLTTGAVQLTESTRLRAALRGIAIEVVRLSDRADLAALDGTIDRLSVCYPDFDVVDGTLRVVQRRHCRLAAAFVEPLQGEGGIRALLPEFVQALRALADAHGFHLIFDEIQSGMGRTGSFTYAEQLGVRPDYVLLGKSLGGGLTKVGALLIDRALYRDEFSLAHSSTFAEDDLSALVAIAALELLDRDALQERCAELGGFASSQLSELKTRYPDVISEVRGRGLMIGVALCDFRRSSSLALQMLAEQELLGYLISGYLLHVHGVRVGPTLSLASVIRIEPSAYVGRAEIARLIEALEQLCRLLSTSDVAGLTSYLVRESSAAHETPMPSTPLSFDSARITVSEPPPHDEVSLDGLPQVAFVAHFAEADDTQDWEPSLAKLTSCERERLLDRIHDVLEPMAHHRTVVHSATGRAICMNVIGLCVDARLMSMYVRSRDRTPILRQLEAAVELAEQLGCSVIGLGGYTSILAGNGLLLKPERAALTTGNALTVSMGLNAIRSCAELRGISLAQARFAAVGAAGNIASIYSELIADEVPSVHLVGRAESLARVEEVAGRVLRGAAERVLGFTQERALRPGGVAAALLDKNVRSALDEGALALDDRGLFNLLSSLLAGKCPVTVGTDLSSLVSADVILAASNSASPIIHAEFIGDHPTIICDISVPPDVDPRLEARRPRAALLQGGVVRMPKNPDFRPPGSPLPPGRCYACLAETAVLGLEGVREHFSYGVITRERVLGAGQLASKHGFVLAEMELQRRGYNSFTKSALERVA